MDSTIETFSAPSDPLATELSAWTESDNVFMDDSVQAESSVASGSEGAEVFLTNNLEAVEVVSEEDIDIGSWAFIGFGTAGIFLIISLGVATCLRILRNSM